ncbi:MAG: HlyD family efflux transporter periplasmic adaptor subunit [Zavarzinella sp.]
MKTLNILHIPKLAACLTFGFLVGCGPSNPNVDLGSPSKSDATDAPMVLGDPLFQYDEYADADSLTRFAPAGVTSNGLTVVFDKSDISSQVDGEIAWLGIETTDDTANSDLFRTEDGKAYRRLTLGDRVKKGTPIVFLDDRLARYESEIILTRAAAAEAEIKEATEALKITDELLARMQKGLNSQSIPFSELVNTLLSRARYRIDQAKVQGEIEVAKSENNKAKLQIERHKIVAPFDGIVVQVLKHRKESVKATDPILVLHNLSRLRAEATLPREYLGSFRTGQPVKLAAPDELPALTTFDKHPTNVPIVGLATTTVGEETFIISASKDGRLMIWGQDLLTKAVLRTRNQITNIAVTAPGAAAPKVLLGTDDGFAMLYDLAIADLTLPAPTSVMVDGETKLKHEGGVQASAFSPDGNWLVTADEKSIYMIDVAQGKLKYTFPKQKHYSSITSLTFTPQGKVVSAGKEPSIIVWKVGATGAEVDFVIEKRTGDVAHPGVTEDGRFLLVDASRNQLDMYHLGLGQKVNSIHSSLDTARFQKFAQFSPKLAGGNQRWIATMNTNEQTVQIWTSGTTTDEPYEVARLYCPRGGIALHSAFSPNATEPFIVVGTNRGEVHLWKLPATAKLGTRFDATTTFVDDALDASGRVRVTIDFNNTDDANRYILRPGQNIGVSFPFHEGMMKNR